MLLYIVLCPFQISQEGLPALPRPGSASREDSDLKRPGNRENLPVDASRVVSFRHILVFLASPPTRQDGADADAHQKRVKQARPRRKHTSLAEMSESKMKESKMTLEMHPKALCPARKLAGPWDYRMTRALRTT